MELLSYIVGQLLGCVAGGFLGYFLSGETLVATLDKEGFEEILVAVGAEALATFIFIVIIQITVSDHSIYQRFLMVAIIGIALFISRIIALETTGASLNPSIAIGL